MTSKQIKTAKAAQRKPSSVTTRQLTKTQLAERRKAAGLKPLTKAQRDAAVAKAAADVQSAVSAAKAGAAKRQAAKAASPKRSQLRDSVVKAWRASKIKDAAKRRKAIATKLDCRGQVMGLLREAGIDGKTI